MSVFYTRGGRPAPRPWEVHASQGLKVGLYTPTILGGNSHLSWFYDTGAIKDPAHTGTSKGLSQAIKRDQLKNPCQNMQMLSVTIQSHGFSAGARTHYVTANGVRNGLPRPVNGRLPTARGARPPRALGREA